MVHHGYLSKRKTSVGTSTGYMTGTRSRSRALHDGGLFLVGGSSLSRLVSLIRSPGPESRIATAGQASKQGRGCRDSKTPRLACTPMPDKAESRVVRKKSQVVAATTVYHAKR